MLMIVMMIQCLESIYVAYCRPSPLGLRIASTAWSRPVESGFATASSYRKSKRYPVLAFARAASTNSSISDPRSHSSKDMVPTTRSLPFAEPPNCTVRVHFDVELHVVVGKKTHKKCKVVGKCFWVVWSLPLVRRFYFKLKCLGWRSRALDGTPVRTVFWIIRSISPQNRASVHRFTNVAFLSWSQCGPCLLVMLGPLLRA